MSHGERTRGRSSLHVGMTTLHPIPAARPLALGSASLMLASAALVGCSGANNTTQGSCATTVSTPVIFVGKVAAGATGTVGGHLVVVSPAHFQVIRYIKGRGPTTVTVATGLTDTQGATTVTEDGILPMVGQIWEIHATSTDQPFQTSICSGSHELNSA